MTRDGRDGEAPRQTPAHSRGGGAGGGATEGGVLAAAERTGEATGTPQPTVWGQRPPAAQACHQPHAVPD